MSHLISGKFFSENLILLLFVLAPRINKIYLKKIVELIGVKAKNRWEGGLLTSNLM